MVENDSIVQNFQSFSQGLKYCSSVRAHRASYICQCDRAKEKENILDVAHGKAPSNHVVVRVFLAPSSPYFFEKWVARESRTPRLCDTRTDLWHAQNEPEALELRHAPKRKGPTENSWAFILVGR